MSQEKLPIKEIFSASPLKAYAHQTFKKAIEEGYNLNDPITEQRLKAHWIEKLDIGHGTADNWWNDFMYVLKSQNREASKQ